MKANKKEPRHTDVVKTVNEVMNLVQAKTNGETKDILFRVFYYDCAPLAE